MMESYMFGGNVAIGALLVATTIAAAFCGVMFVVTRHRYDAYEPIEHEPPADRAVTSINADFMEGSLQ